MDAVTIDMICKLIREIHTTSHLPLVAQYPHEESSAAVFMILQESLNMLQICLNLPYHLSHQATTSLAWLLDELHKCIVDFSQITTSQAMVAYAELQEVLNSNSLEPSLQRTLLLISNKLRIVLGDDARMAQEAQMMQTIQLSYRKGDALGRNSDDDIVTCSLMLRHLVSFHLVFFAPFTS